MRIRGAVTLLPPAAAGWPSPLLLGAGPARNRATAQAALDRIREEALWWPPHRSGAARPRALWWGRAGHAAAADWPEGAARRGGAQVDVNPAALEALLHPPQAAARLGSLGGLRLIGVATPDPVALLTCAAGRDPWSGAPIDLAAALDAAVFLRDAARCNAGPPRLIGMSAWKQRCVAPFLTGPDGPPRRAAADARPASAGGPLVRWGAEGEADLYAEDGLLRSVGLGLRHTPPISLAISMDPPFFDATRPNAFERIVANAEFGPALLARAAALRELVVRAALTKYNLSDAAPLPDPGARMALLAAGQVADDASIRLGARAVRDDSALLRAARARWPDAFILYKPHPDVVTGLRPGRADREAEALADAVVERCDMARCLDWSDRVATITSLTGFEALLRGKPATVFGRPFYAGWGLTDDVDPPPRCRNLSLDALVAAALILMPRYIDPDSGLPAPPEIAAASLIRQRGAASGARARLRRLWRDAVSWTLNRL